jgi:deoxyribodipyrimidine photolyase-related protein
MTDQLFVASANYLNKMSNSCSSCVDKPRLLTEEKACAFNFLYWDLIVRHRYKLKLQVRWNLILAKLDYISPDELKINHQEAEEWYAPNNATI